MYQWEPHINHHLLGTPHQIQNEMSNECVRASNNLEWKMSTTPEVMEAAKNWQFLFRLDCDHELNVEWGDGEIVFFWIKKSDLQNHTFDKTWAIMQCY